MEKTKYGYCLWSTSIQMPTRESVVEAKGDKQWLQAQRINKACDIPPQYATNVGKMSH
jgi:hypothetical protein